MGAARKSPELQIVFVEIAYFERRRSSISLSVNYRLFLQIL